MTEPTEPSPRLSSRRGEESSNGFGVRFPRTVVDLGVVRVEFWSQGRGKAGGCGGVDYARRQRMVEASPLRSGEV
ncbi:hypothetical protein GQ457_11G028380 [Hibiscus cannabinus]